MHDGVLSQDSRTLSSHALHNLARRLINAVMNLMLYAPLLLVALGQPTQGSLAGPDPRRRLSTSRGGGMGAW